MAADGKMAGKTYIAQILGAAPLFNGVSDADLNEAARYARIASFQRGKPIVPPKGKPGEIYIIAHGVAAALHDHEGGRGILTQLYGAGDVAGLGDAPEGGRNLIALVNIEAVAITHSDFDRMRRRSTELTDSTIARLREEIDEISHLLSTMLNSSLEARLAAFFSRIASLVAGNEWEPTANIGRITQTQSAQLLGVTREHVNRTLTMWEKSGLIFQTKTGDIIIENRKRLGLLAAERNVAKPSGEGERLWEIDAYLDNGLNQTAFNLAAEAAKRTPKDVRFRHRAVLATVRSGALQEALALIEGYKLSDDYSNEELACLRPRIQRDIAFSTNAATPDQSLLMESAAEYEKAFAQTRGYYSGVNAAATYAMAGDDGAAKRLAKETEKLAVEQASDLDVDEPSYWLRATIAECRLICGDRKSAAADFTNACLAADVTPGKKAATRKQLRRLSASLPIDGAWIDAVVPQKGVLFFSGPLAPPEEKMAADLFGEMRAALNAYLAHNPIGSAFGALASGSDIVIAEALLQAGVSLNVYLPLAPGEFKEVSIMRSGGDWEERYIACIERAQTIDWNRRAKPSRASFQLGAFAAMGKTLRHAVDLDAQPHAFFAYQKGKTPENSVSKENERIWRTGGYDFTAFEKDWPLTPAAMQASEDSDIVYALLVEGGPDDQHSIAALFDGTGAKRHSDGGVAIGIFNAPEKAIATAMRIKRVGDLAGARFWLDAGVCADNRSADDSWSTTFITAACRPATSPGAVFASEIFALAVAALGVRLCRFEYVGYAAGQEKLEPCPLYLASF